MIHTWEITINNYTKLKEVTKTIPCEGCLRSAQHNHKHPRKGVVARNARRANKPGEAIHLDLMKLPITSKVVKDAPPTSMLKYPLALVAVDSYSDWSWIVFLKDKHELTIKAGISKIITQLKSANYNLRNIYSDGEKGVWAKEQAKWLESEGIVPHLTFSSQQNLAEAKIKQLRSIAKHSMKHRYLSVDFVHHAFRYANTILCLCPKSRLGGRTSYQEYHGKNPARELNRLRTFGSICYYHERNVASHKHDSTRELIFVGFIPDQPYRAIDPRTQGTKTIHSWHAIFNETSVNMNWLSQITKKRLKPLPVWDEIPDDDDIPMTNPPTNIESIESKHPDTSSTAPPTSGGEKDKVIEVESERNLAKETRAPTLKKTVTPIRQSKRSNFGQPQATWSPTLNAGQKYSTEQRMADAAFWSESMLSNDIPKSTEKRHETLIKPKYPKEWNIKIPKTIKQAFKSEYREE
jgi:hypothetical protein